MKRLMAVFACVAALSLTGCSSSPTYEAVEDLTDAFIDAGGSCDDPKPVTEEMVGEGADSVFCVEDGGLAALLVFETSEQKDAYIAAVSTAAYDGEIIAGDTWAISGYKISGYAKDLGGELVTG